MTSGCSRPTASVPGVTAGSSARISIASCYKITTLLDKMAIIRYIRVIMDKIKVLVIDKQAYFRAGVCQALSGEEELELAECSPDDNPMGLIETNAHDVVLLDIDPPSFSGLSLGREIARYCPNTKVIMLTPARPNDDELFEVIKVGAVAYLSKNTTPQDLAQMISKVFNSEYPISESLLARPKVAETVLKQFQGIVANGKAMDSIISPLTFREIQVLNYIADGNSNKKIAQILEISEQTIKNHVSNILRKSKANDRTQAVVIAMRQGWIQAEEEAPSQTT